MYATDALFILNRRMSVLLRERFSEVFDFIWLRKWPNFVFGTVFDGRRILGVDRGTNRTIFCAGHVSDNEELSGLSPHRWSVA